MPKWPGQLKDNQIYKILYYQDTVSDYPIYTALESRPDIWTPSFGQTSSTESNNIE